MRERRWKLVALLAAGIAIGVVMIGTPASAHVGGTVNHLWNHLKPKADKRYLPGGNLPAGKTVRGDYSASAVATAGGQVVLGSIQFGWTFPGSPTPHFIALGDPAPAECPGTAALPGAAPGHLCVWERANANRTVNGIYSATGTPGSDRTGAIVSISSSAAGSAYSAGSWAAKAGAATPRPVAPKATGRAFGS